MDPEQITKAKGKGWIAGTVLSILAIASITGAVNQQSGTTDSNKTNSSHTTNIPAASTDTTPPATAQVVAPVETPPPAPTPAPAAVVTPPPPPKTCSTGYYLNVDGNCIQSPTSAPSAPAGATGICNDGAYTFAVHHQGACSHHGGVASWL